MRIDNFYDFIKRKWFGELFTKSYKILMGLHEEIFGSRFLKACSFIYRSEILGKTLKISIVILD